MMANTWSIGEMTHGGKWPSFIDKRQWVEFKEIYHNRIALSGPNRLHHTQPGMAVVFVHVLETSSVHVHCIQYPCPSPSLIV